MYYLLALLIRSTVRHSKSWDILCGLNLRFAVSEGPKDGRRFFSDGA